MHLPISLLNLNMFILYFFLVICIYGMIQMIKLLREIRIISSMTLKAILKICENKEIIIDIQKIQKDVEKNL